MKTHAIIQARLGSTRLPRKVLADICGKTMLERVVSRVKRSRLVDGVIVATPDPEIVQATKRTGAAWWLSDRPEQDVLGRFFDAACHFSSDVIVRVTSDCPFADPDVIDQVIATQAAEGVDYCANNLYATYPRGIDVEVFTMDAMFKANEHDVEMNSREHVTEWMRSEACVWRHGVTTDPNPWPNARLTVDTTEDLERARRIYAALGCDDFRWWEAARHA